VLLTWFAPLFIMLWPLLHDFEHPSQNGSYYAILDLPPFLRPEALFSIRGKSFILCLLACVILCMAWLLYFTCICAGACKPFRFLCVVVDGSRSFLVFGFRTQEPQHTAIYFRFVPPLNHQQCWSKYRIVLY
jgi:hypothetical protein